MMGRGTHNYRSHLAQGKPYKRAMNCFVQSKSSAWHLCRDLYWLFAISIGSQNQGLNGLFDGWIWFRWNRVFFSVDKIVTPEFSSWCYNEDSVGTYGFNAVRQKTIRKFKTCDQVNVLKKRNCTQSSGNKY